MDVVGGVLLADGRECKVLSGIDQVCRGPGYGWLKGSQTF